MAFKRAERTKLWARVAIYGPSGSGKSFTAMRIANGLARRAGSRIAAIDTENRSLSKYADRFDFDVDDLGDRTIDTYLASINQCIKEGYKVLVIDSLSHAWKELLEEVDRIASKSFSGNNWAAWSKGTPKQNKLVNAIVNFPGHLIVTMRSKTEWALDKDKDGKNTITRNGLSPEQGKGIEYEFDVLMDINQGHIAEIQKDRTGKFQDQMIEKPGEEFGEALYEWLNSGTAPPPPPPSTLRQQCIDSWNELKSVMLSTADDGSRLFTNDECNAVQETMAAIKEKSDDEKFAIINKLLNEQKKQLHIRYENWCKLNHLGPETEITPEPPKKEDTPIPPPQQPEKPVASVPAKPSGQRSIKDDLNKALQEKAENPQLGSVPSMFAEPEEEPRYFEDDIPGERELVTADDELDIF